MDFRSPAFLQRHLLHTLAFYDGRCLDPSGGFFHFYKDDGHVYDRETRHLVSSTRFVYNFAAAACRFPAHPRAAAWREAAAHGLRFVQDVHFNPHTGSHAWLLHWDGRHATVQNGTQHAYGLAFVLLAHAHALRAGVAGARVGLDATVALLEQRFWSPAAGLYADEIGSDGRLGSYRGQNANMHACEAMLAAFDATGEAWFLDRAARIAENVTVGLAAQAGGLLWEHYCEEGNSGRWAVDWDYHRSQPGDLFRPWGFQTGHLTEWAKLLLTLELHQPDAASGLQRVQRARALFDAAMAHGWDTAHGGLVYGFAGSGVTPADGPMAVCDGDKYFWVQAESIAAAARLAQRTNDTLYWTWYEGLWAYAWQHFVDHRHGAWYRVLAPDNSKRSDEKSPAGKTDYHTMGACHDVLDVLQG